MPLSIGPVCVCRCTHIYQGVRYEDCPYCSCVAYAPSNRRDIDNVVYFRSARQRVARSRLARSTDDVRRLT